MKRYNPFGNLDAIETSNPDEWRINCPFCIKSGKGEDDKQHLYVNVSKGLFNCFRCGSKGTIGQLLKYGIHGKAKGPSPEFDKLRERINKVYKRPELKTFDLDQISWKLDKDTPIAFKYMLDRGFSEQEIRKYDLRVGKSYVVNEETGETVKKWAGRVIFPFYDNGQVVYLVGRAYCGKEPKYINSKGDKSQIIYGIDNIKDRTCILCEGIISAIAAERITNVSAVSMLGKTATNFQLSRLREQCDIAYACLDGGVEKIEKTKLNLRLLSFGFKVAEISLPGEKDPDELGSDFKQFFDEARWVYF